MIRRPSADDLARARADTRAIYERQADGWDRHRPKGLHEQAWFNRFLASVRPGGAVLDLGCGAGDPLGGYIIDRGYRLTGLDYSAPMLELARARYPDAEWIQGDMRRLSFETGFDGVVSWDGSFHLSRDEQRQLLSEVASLLNPGGALMLTIGASDGEVLGVVEGEYVYHASLAPEEYGSRLTEVGFTDVSIVLEDADCDMHSVVLASKV